MADDKKNIPDAGKVDVPTNPGKVEPAKADSRCGISLPRPRQRPRGRGALQSGKSEAKPQSPAWEPCPTGKVGIFPLSGMGRRRASLGKACGPG